MAVLNRGLEENAERGLPMTLEPAENIELTILAAPQARRITTVANQTQLNILKQQGI